jgi:hypothetical protein
LPSSNISPTGGDLPFDHPASVLDAEPGEFVVDVLPEDFRLALLQDERIHPETIGELLACDEGSGSSPPGVDH